MMKTLAVVALAASMSATTALADTFTSMSLQEQKQVITALRESVELLSPSKVIKQLS